MFVYHKLWFYAGELEIERDGVGLSMEMVK